MKREGRRADYSVAARLMSVGRKPPLDTSGALIHGSIYKTDADGKTGQKSAKIFSDASLGTAVTMTTDLYSIVAPHSSRASSTEKGYTTL